MNTSCLIQRNSKFRLSKLSEFPARGCLCIWWPCIQRSTLEKKAGRIFWPRWGTRRSPDYECYSELSNGEKMYFSLWSLTCSKLKAEFIESYAQV